MALPNFFDQVEFSAAQVLQNHSNEEFKKILLNNNIGVVCEEQTYQTFEGRMIADMLIRLLARLYPNLRLVSNSEQVVRSLRDLAKAINPVVDFTENETATIFIGTSDYKTEVSAFYLGSDGWDAFFSIHSCKSVGKTNNAFGAGAAACIGAANLFRFLFKDHLPETRLDEEICFSTYYHRLISNPTDFDSTPPLPKASIGKRVLVGAGAIGNSFLWALKDGPFTGNLHLVDNQKIELSNLQRYVLALQEGIGRHKVKVIEELFLSSGVKIIPHRCNWREFVQSFSLDGVESLVSAVDSAETRIEIQAALPKTIFNGWTGNESLGVSRHTDFIEDACLACLYLPSHEKPSYSQMVAEALNMVDLEREIVRDYLANQKAIDRSLLNMISERKAIPIESLLSFEGRLLSEFYTEAVCGSRIMQMQLDNEKVPSEVEVPLAFESALAGILLASEVVIDSMGGRKDKIPCITRINLLMPLSHYSTEMETKHFSGTCICQDEIFKIRYERKWFGNKKSESFIVGSDASLNSI